MSTLPTILVIVGITGDLATRYLLPAVAKLAQAGALPEHFRVVGITRRADSHLGDLLKNVPNPDFLLEHGELFSMNLEVAEEYDRLAQHLDQLSTEFGGTAQCLFYLSVPPKVSQPIIEFLGSSGLSNDATTKLLLEKPFGTNLQSATELVAHTERHFSADQVYRIDHYLAKEMAQNLLVFREDNYLFKQTWNKDFIQSIHIFASEKIGIEGRASFYEHTGALRDITQSHLLQLAALTLMQPPRMGSMGEVPALRLQALEQLHLPEGPVQHSAFRAQYEGYRNEVANPTSATETFVSITLASDDPRWEGVPITLSTGKALDQKVTEICLTYKHEQGYQPNYLTLRLQPNEGIEFCLWTKAPGYERKIEQHGLSFVYQDHFEVSPDAYERVLLDAIESDHTLFTSGEEVAESWRILQPVLDAWAQSSDDLASYRPGTALAEVRPTPTVL